MHPSLINGRQIRMARGALKWSVAELAAQSGVSVSTIKRMEEAGDNIPNTLTGMQGALRQTFEARGIQFINAGERAAGQGIAFTSPHLTLGSHN